MPAIDDLIRTSKYKHELFQNVRNQLVFPKCRDGDPYESYALRLTAQNAT